MSKLFDAGHEQLFEAECSGLRAAWRRAAEHSVRDTRVERTDAREPGGRNGAGSIFGAAVATLLLGLQYVPFIFQARETSESNSAIDRPATKFSRD